MSPAANADSSTLGQVFKDKYRYIGGLLRHYITKLYGCQYKNGPPDTPWRGSLACRSVPWKKVRARSADNQPVWDADGETIVLNRPATFARWTLILDREGKVAYKNTRADPSQSSQEVLRVVEALEKKAK